MIDLMYLLVCVVPILHMHMLDTRVLLNLQSCSTGSLVAELSPNDKFLSILALAFGLSPAAIDLGNMLCS